MSHGRHTLIALIGATLAGCSSAAPAATMHDASTVSGAPSPDATSTSALSLLVEPGAGAAALDALIGSARHSVDLTMYELEDDRAERLLADDAARGVVVEVILNRSYTEAANNSAYSSLQSHGVQVHWASPRYAITHQKTLIVDGSVSAIMSMNWTSRYYSDTRDVVIIDRIASDVAAIQATFKADYAGTPIVPATGEDLVWSPTTSLHALLSVINGAHRSLYVENEEMASRDVIDALTAAARRGVDVEICMTDSTRWASAFGELTGAGAHVSVYAPDASLYIHAKILVRDPGAADELAFAGSQNFSTASLKYNRELGILIRDSTLITQLTAVIRGDERGASRWGN